MKKKFTLLFLISTFSSWCIVFAQHIEIIPATRADSAFFQMDKDGKIYQDGFKSTLKPDQISGLESAAVQQVKDFNHYLSELWKTWDEAKGTGAYSSENHFYEKKKEFEQLALRLFLFDGNDGVEQTLQLYRAFFDRKNNSFYRYVKNNDKEYRIPAEHIVYKDGVYRDSVYEDKKIPAAKIWVTSKYSSYSKSPSVKKHIRNIQTSARKSYGYVKFNGGEYKFTQKLQWNEGTKRYEGAIDYWQEFQRVTPEGLETYSDRTHHRVIVYVLST